MSQILNGDDNARASFEQHNYHNHYGNRRSGLIGPWRTNTAQTVTCIELFGGAYLLGSLRTALLKEAIGIGPQRYCIYYYESPEFYRKLKLIMMYLPQEKMFIYPSGIILRGPFLQEPWLSRGRAICARPSLTPGEFHDFFIAPF